MCIVRLQQGLGALKGVPTVEVSVLECCATEAGSERAAPFELLDFDFFDSQVLVIVYRPKDAQSACSSSRMAPLRLLITITARIATIGYANLIYHPIPSHEYVNGTTRKALMDEVLHRLGSGQVRSAVCAAGWHSAVVAMARGGVDGTMGSTTFSF